MINLAQLADNAPLYIVHLSNGLGLDYLRLAQRRHQPVWIETCPQYLLLDDRCYEREDALGYLLSPPLRNASNNDALWCGIADGSIDVVATDHCAFSMAQRQQLSGGDFSRCPNGLPGVENRLLLMFSHGVMTGRISAQRFVALTSATPAKLFGLWPKKGRLRPAQMAMSSLSIRSAPPRSAMRCCMTTPTIHPGRALFARARFARPYRMAGSFLITAPSPAALVRDVFYAVIPFLPLTFRSAESHLK